MNAIANVAKQDSFVALINDYQKADKEIANATNRLNKAKSGVSGKLMALVVEQSIKSAKVFLTRCEEAESEWREQFKKAPNLPRSYTQAKSNIKAALEMGLNVADFETESAMRKELNAQRKANKEQERAQAEERIQESVAYGPHAQDISAGDYYAIKVKHAVDALAKQGDPAKCETAQQLMDDMLNKLHALLLADVKEEHEVAPAQAQVRAIK